MKNICWDGLWTDCNSNHVQLSLLDLTWSVLPLVFRNQCEHKSLPRKKSM